MHIWTLNIQYFLIHFQVTLFCMCQFQLEHEYVANDQTAFAAVLFLFLYIF